MNKMQAVTVEEAEAAPAPKKRKRIAVRKTRWGVMLAIPLIILAVLAYWWMTSGSTVSTDNAAVKQDIVSVAPQINGPLIEVDVKNGDNVKQGQVLYRIDPEPFRVALLDAEAKLAAAQLQTSQLRTQAAGTSGDIAGAQANLSIKQNALGRQQALLKRGFTTKADYEDALNEVKAAETQLSDARARSANASAAIATGEQPSIAAALAAVAKAKLDLKRTTVVAPMAGQIANADRVQVGNMAVIGVGMLSLVRSKGAWVDANFKEKDVGRIVPGQKVKIKIDAYPGTAFQGHVQSIGAGTGSEFSILPAQNANGNWVKVTQRVPVRIAFDGKTDKPLIAGLSADVTVYLDD
ncbi:HlyD family secretion protein [Sphingomonas alba]|uniref:HlyD family secretion protein n=1 Tax=Sphingomonas alba TaxID=2908208 RepID=A0ABT0RID4_9SPHN|nr:HlyD family secretion protein [Sphingomonas alba]MCL6682305.1 HlyD family secretion protein [Sphingomonas alba]